MKTQRKSNSKAKNIDGIGFVQKRSWKYVNEIAHKRI